LKANPNDIVLNKHKSKRTTPTFGGNPLSHSQEVVIVTPVKVLIISKSKPRMTFESYRCGYCAIEGFHSENALYAHLSSHVKKRVVN